MSIRFLAPASLLAIAACSGTGGGTHDENLPPLASGTSTLSGAAESGYIDGARGTARFANPVNVAYGPDGQLYVADFDNNRIRGVDPETGDAYTAVEQAGFRRPFGMLFDGNTLYVTTDDDSKGRHGLMTGSLWKVDIGSGVATLIVEDIGRPRGMAMMGSGRLAMSDYEHHVIQVVNVTTRQVTPLAGVWDVKGRADGTGAAATFSTPYGMVYTGDKLLVADFDNSTLRTVDSSGAVTTVAGGGAGFADGAMGAAQFSKPQAMSMASDGTIYLTDLGNYRVRRIVNGDTVETVAGNGQGGSVDNEDSLSAELYGLEGLSVTPDGSAVFVADGGRGEPLPHNYIRRILFQ